MMELKYLVRIGAYGSTVRSDGIAPGNYFSASPYIIRAANHLMCVPMTVSGAFQALLDPIRHSICPQVPKSVGNLNIDHAVHVLLIEYGVLPPKLAFHSPKSA